MSDALSDLPYRVSRLVPGGRKGGRTKSRGWTRPRRIALALTVVAVLGGGAATSWIMLRGRDPAREVWHLHDQAVEDFRAGRFEAVAAKCRRILELSPADAIARFNLGAALIQLGRRDEGLAEIAAAAKDRPEFDDAHLMLGEDALRRGDEDRAYEELRLVTAAPPTPGAAEALFAGILRRRGRHAEAMPHLRAALADPLAEPIVRVRSGIALGRLHGVRALVPAVASREGRAEVEAYRQAREIVNAAIDAPGVGSGLSELLCARAELRLALEGPNEALVDADDAVNAAADPAAKASARVLRAQIYAIQDNRAAAEKELADALLGDVRPPAEVFREIASIYAVRNDTAKALDVLAKGCDLHPADLELGLARAEILFRRGQPDEAEAECARVVAANPRDTAAHVLHGDIRRARDDLDGARRSYEAAVALRPTDVVARLRLAGTAFDESGRRAADAESRLAESERIASEILASSPSDPAALLALAKVRLAASPGRDPRPPGAASPVNAEAKRLLVASVEGDPLSLEARTFLAYANWLVRNDQEAAVDLQQILSSLPGERPRLRLLHARCLLAAGASKEAVAAANRAAAGLPDDAGAWRVAADAGRAAGDTASALAALSRLETLEPGDFDHLFGQAALLAAAGRVSAAEERFAAADARAEAIADADARSAAESLIATARAEFYRAQGDLERARSAYAGVLGRNPKVAAPYVGYARFLLKLGQEAEAEREIERALAAEPASVEARRILCEIGFRRGAMSPLLVAQVGEVERIAPKDPAVWYLRGKLAVLAGDLALGREFLSRYAETAPDDPDGQYALGVALGRSGLFDEAVKRLETAGALLPGSPEVRVALAKVRQAWAMRMMQGGRLLEAKSALRRALAEDPSARDARALLVDTLRLTGEVELSEREVRALLHADPKDAAAIRMLAALQVQTARLEDAKNTLHRLVEAVPLDWTAWQFLSAVLADMGALDQAETAARTCLATAPEEPGALAPLLHVLSIRGQFDAAARAIAEASSKHPDAAPYEMYLAMLRSQEGRHEEAAAAAGRALDKQPVFPSALELLIRSVASGLGDAPRAESLARERVARAKDDPGMQYPLAALVADMGRRDDAIALLEKGAAADAPLLPAIALRAMLLLERGEHAAARDLLKRGLDVFADAPDLHYLMAQAWLSDPAGVRDGEPVEPARDFAVAELQSVLAIVRLHAPAMNNLAWLLSRDEATRAQSLDLAERLVAAYDSYPPYLDTYGTVLRRLGRRDAALAAYQRALGACEAQRTELAKRSAGKVAPIEASRLAALARRLERVTAEVKGHYDEMLKGR